MDNQKELWLRLQIRDCRRAGEVRCFHQEEKPWRRRRNRRRNRDESDCRRSRCVRSFARGDRRWREIQEKEKGWFAPQGFWLHRKRSSRESKKEACASFKPPRNYVPRSKRKSDLLCHCSAPFDGDALHAIQSFFEQ